MSLISAYLDKFEYDDWANRRALESLRSVPAESDRGRRLLAHIVGAQYVWLSRIEGGDPVTEAWPDISLTEVDARIEWLRGTWGMLLDQSATSGADRRIKYLNLAGKPFESSLHEILDHVLFHGAYHRGQVAAVVRAEGGTPVNTDYIQFTRR